MTITFEEVLQKLENGQIYTGISGVAKRAWFKYCYHFSHVENLISILETGYLFSRAEATRQELMINDNASADVISQTDAKYQEYVRLYFRPKSPTQYNNEGFKTVDELQKSTLNAQCPVPVFLFFDFIGILNHPQVQFSERSLAIQDENVLYSTPEEFRQLPFDKIYHDNFFTADEKREIIGHRHAEIIVPRSLKIDDYLQKIIVRSPAERETLLSLMSERTRRKYGSYIQIDTTNNVFFSRWTYFYQVDLYNNQIDLQLRISEYKRKNENLNFDFKMELYDRTGLLLTSEIRDWSPRSSLVIPFRSNYEYYRFKIYFDGYLMYAGEYHEESELPY